MTFSFRCGSKVVIVPCITRSAAVSRSSPPCRLVAKQAKARWLMAMTFGSPVLPDVVIRYAMRPGVQDGRRGAFGNKASAQ